jgi:hypothetical protein
MLESQVKRITHTERAKMTQEKFSKTFVFNVPSVLSFDWLFEFRCDLTVTDAQEVVVDITDATIGSAQVKIKCNGPMWRTWLKVWELCQKAALAFAHKTNTEDKDDPLFVNGERRFD